MDDEKDIECLLDEGRPTIEDLKCLAREIRDNPEELRQLYKLLGLTDDELKDWNGAGPDSTDGALILSHPLTLDKCTDLTYGKIAAGLPNRRDMVVKYCKNMIPFYILASDKNTLTAYQRALIYGKTYDKRVKVMLIGAERAGKTSVGKALRGEAFNADEASTDDVLISEVIENASERPWRNSKVHRKSSVVNPSAKQTGLVQTDGNLTSRCTTELDVECTTYDISSLIEDNFGYDEVDSRADAICPVIWDFAGQPFHRAIHPIFMSPEAVYVLTFDLSKNLFDKTKGNRKKNRSVPKMDSEDSNLDHIMRWMDIVHSLKRSTDGDTLPPVILVGTHADCVEDPEAIMKSLLDRFYKNRLFGKHIAGSVVVDNTRAGNDQEDPQIVRLRQLILEVANEMPHTKKKVPLQWLYIESKIQEQAHSGVKYIPRGAFKEEIVEKACNIQGVEDVEPILHFLHDRGTIIYHEHANDPNNLVILDPQWLVKVLCKILTAIPNREERINIRSHRKELHEKGILAKELLDYACKELDVEQIEQSLLFLMEKFNLLFRCPSKDNQEIFLVPCMLTARPGKEVIPITNNATFSPVYLTFKTNYVPVGLFSRLVVQFGVWAATKTSCEQQQIYANAARIVLDGKSFLGLVCFKSVIKVQLWSQDNSESIDFGDSGLHSEVYSYLVRSLEKMREECHWLRSLSWELCVQCRMCAGKVDSNTGNCIWHDTNCCLHDDCAHYISLANYPLHCPYAKGHNPFLPEENFSPWIEAVNNNNIPEVTSAKPRISLTSTESPLNASRSSSNVIRVVLLAGEWGSSKGGLPTINRQLAIELAKSTHLEVSFYVVQCTEEEKRIAADIGISIIVAKKRPGYEDLDRLGFPPEELPAIDVVVGHGAKLGRQAQLFQTVYPRCVWVQFVHTAPEELSMYKNYQCNISKGEKKHHTEVQLSKLADLVVAVGPRLAEYYKTNLRHCHDPKERVFEITPEPSIFQEFQECKQAKDDREKFNVLMFGRGDAEDFELKGFDIAAKAIAELKDKNYRLYCVGASSGSEEDVAKKLLQHIPRDQLVVRGFIESRKDLANLLCNVDLAIMPSRTEGFGLTALEALSAGLPILVSGNSGFASALQKMENPLASSCVVSSEEGKDWAKKIQAVKEKPRKQRLHDAKRLKERYEKKYVWSQRCEALQRRMLALVQERRAKGNDKNNGEEKDEARTHAQSAEGLPEECNRPTHQLPPAVETTERPEHGWEQEDNNNDLVSTAKEESDDRTVKEPSISPEVEEPMLKNQEETEFILEKDKFQQTMEGFQQTIHTKNESITDIRCRRGVQWSQECEENGKEYVNSSKNNEIKVWYSILTKTFIAGLVIAAVFTVIGAYTFH